MVNYIKISNFALTLILLFSCSKENLGVVTKTTEPTAQNVVSASVITFSPATGSYYSGDKSTSYTTIKNNGNVAWLFWVGCSIQDKSGKWYDLEADSVRLNPGEISKNIDFSWVAPDQSSLISGEYLVRVAIWKTPPTHSQTQRLDFSEKSNAFSVFSFFDTFDSIDTNYWDVISKPTPGLGTFKPENIIANGGALYIQLPKNTKDGGELKADKSKVSKYGTYRTRMKTPSQLPGTYSTFFLYNSNTLDEIDIEIWNDGSFTLDMTTWIKEKMKYSNKITLEFDPSADFHEYRIDYYPNEISFWVDNQKVGSTSDLSQIPSSDMWIYISGWWPRWMTGDSSPVDKFVIYDWIKH